jgi:hypothetical protein
MLLGVTPIAPGYSEAAKQLWRLWLPMPSLDFFYEYRILRHPGMKPGPRSKPCTLSRQWPGHSCLEAAVQPRLADLQWADGVVPTPHGGIAVTWQRFQEHECLLRVSQEALLEAFEMCVNGTSLQVGAMSFLGGHIWQEQKKGCFFFKGDSFQSSSMPQIGQQECHGIIHS